MAASRGFAETVTGTTIVGVMPDLGNIAAQLGTAPDVYVRDSVADTGMVPSTMVFQSPDIILRQVASTNPQTEFGEGSPLANQVPTNDPVVANTDNDVYVRIRNRSGVDAAGVTAAVYWSEASTLVAPVHWNSIGQINAGTVLGGGALHVAGPLKWHPAPGGVMRTPPAGMIRWGDPFELGRDLAAITHGHPTGFLAAGCLALLVHEILEGRSLPDAVATTLARLMTQPHHQECLAAIDAAAAAWQSGAPPSAETVERLGKGWVAEEALAIGLYSALAAGDDFAAGVKLAVNHGGDSDSTGAIAGNLLGALLGVHAIPKPWLEALELRDEITALADDLLTRFRADPEWGDRYPGW